VNLETARAIADAVLYEGYLLYPYRASAQKNRSRWQFGVVMPADYADADESERPFTQAECVVEGDADTAFTVALRFLQVQQRTVSAQVAGSLVPVAALDVDGTPLAAWDEAVEREIVFTMAGLRDDQVFHVEGGETTEPVHDRAGTLIGQVVRRRRPLSGVVILDARPLPGPWRALLLRVRVENRTTLPDAGDREAALPAALVASHTIIGVSGGSFVSMVDPPEWASEAVAACVNVGTWPVLAGPPGQRDVMLCAPIILYDHPEIAPESPGDMFDATEIDEILTLRTLALSDAEKREARATDPRAAALIDRTEALDGQQLERLHGAIRYLRPVPGDRAVPGDDPSRASQSTPWWDPEADASVSPGTDTVVVAGQRVASGSRVLLRPGARRADAQDMFLAGRPALVEAVLRDVDDNLYLAVTLAEDPAADLQRSHGRFLYFGPDEVEPCDD
jgi:hypothetical protein